ncbi:MAG: hypothetical protein CMJ78_07310 [Planctomycetaceae bacterium]|nr:hypothetical protein [Planctomycetaceae bacterium]
MIELTAMENQRNDLLAGVLIEVGRSALQYMGECWPWTGSDEQGNVLKQLIQNQAAHVPVLVGLLGDRRQLIDFGTYPTEYTDLHYTGVDFLLSLLVQNQTALVGILEKAVTESGSDADANVLLTQILAQERENLERLSNLEPEEASK